MIFFFFDIAQQRTIGAAILSQSSVLQGLKGLLGDPSAFFGEDALGRDIEGIYVDLSKSDLPHPPDPAPYTSTCHDARGQACKIHDRRLSRARVSPPLRRLSR